MNKINIKVNEDSESGFNQYLPYDGTFIVGKSVEENIFIYEKTYTCREEFMVYALRLLGKNTKEYSFCLVVKNLNTEEYKSFIERVLNKIDAPSDSIKICPTNYYNIIFVTISDWWINSKIRQEFLTILLRCYGTYRGAGNYKSLNEDYFPIDDIIFSHKYFQQTEDAVGHFMKGNTLLKIGFSCGGWVENFKENKKNPLVALVKVNLVEQVKANHTVL